MQPRIAPSSAPEAAASKHACMAPRPWSPGPGAAHHRRLSATQYGGTESGVFSCTGAIDPASLITWPQPTQPGHTSSTHVFDLHGSDAGLTDTYAGRFSAGAGSRMQRAVSSGILQGSCAGMPTGALPPVGACLGRPQAGQGLGEAAQGSSGLGTGSGLQRAASEELHVQGPSMQSPPEAGYMRQKSAAATFSKKLQKIKDR